MRGTKKKNKGKWDSHNINIYIPKKKKNIYQNIKI